MKKMDAVYIRVRNGEVKKTVEVANGVIMDLDGKGHVRGVEVLDPIEIEKNK